MTFAAVIAALGDLVVSTTEGLSARTPAPTGVAYDSRRVTAGAVFVALKGLKADGLDFVPEALRRGAALIVS